MRASKPIIDFATESFPLNHQALAGRDIHYVNDTNIQVLFGARSAFGGSDQYSSTQHEASFSKGTRDVDLGAKVQFLVGRGFRCLEGCLC